MGMLRPEEWLSQAETLHPGMSIKVPHVGCTDSNALCITYKAEGLTAYCFKCQGRGFKQHDDCNMSDYLDRRDAIRAIEEAKLLRDHTLPVDFSHSLPERAQVWLASNGLKPSLWKYFNVGWSEKLQRVILPCNSTSNYIGYTARGIYKNQIKYIERIKHNEATYFNRLNNNTLRTWLDVCVVVEDWMSAAVVSQVADCYPLLGTSASIKFLGQLVRYGRVYLWLDPDKAGLKGRTALFKELKLITDVRIIKSTRDPKMYSKEEIQRRVYD